MAENRKSPAKKDISLFKSLSAELKERQSTRATFRLSEGCIDAISIVATQMGIKQKSLFDHLAEDMDSLRSIANDIRHMKARRQGRVQKTFVISRKALASLEEISQLFNAPRDALIERSIQRLLPIINKERAKHEQRKEFLKKIEKHFEQGENILKDIRQHLGDDDPIINRFAMVMASYETVKNSMRTFIDKSRNIENFDADELWPKR
jgi:hypothetical protein